MKSGISHRLSHKRKEVFEKSQEGAILILAISILALLLILGTYFLTFCLTESRIAKSQQIATQAYYLTEAGINKAIWKLKNQDPWKTCFASTSLTYGCDCNTWESNFQMSLMPNSTTTVAIKNTECGRGQISATSTLVTPDKKVAQRVVKTTVYKSLASPTQGASVFSGGASENIDITLSKIKVYGNLFSNNNLDIKLLSAVYVYATGSAEGKILAANNYNKSDDSTVSSTAQCAKNICNTTTTCACLDAEKFETCSQSGCKPKSIATPRVDFNSASSTSFKKRAQAAQDAGLCQVFCKKSGQAQYQCSNKCVFSAAEFEDLLWEVREDGILTLNTTSSPQIVYVEGGVDLKGGRHLVVNGALAADSTIKIGENYSWTKGGDKDEGFSQITVNRPTATTTSGILTQAKINFGLFSSFGTTTIVGVVYANDEIRLTSLPQSFTIQGGIIGRKLSFISILSWFNFILDDDIILYGLGYKIDSVLVSPVYSPIITVEHWEEEY